MTDDDCLHGIDSVDADDIGTRHHAELTGVRARRLAQASPKSLRLPRIARTQDDEHSSAAPEGIDRRSARGPAIAADDEIDGSGHCVDLAAADLSIRWVPLIVVSACQRGGDRRGVLRRVASAPGLKIERSGHTS